MNRLLPLGIVAAPALLAAQANVGTLTVRLDRPLHPVAKEFYGLMTEEINHSYDGGIYGELLQNRALNDDPARPAHWTLIGGGTPKIVDEAVPGTALTHAVELPGGASLSNDGFWGVPLQADTEYRASFYVAGEPGPIAVLLTSADGARTFASATTRVAGNGWRRVEVRMRTGATTPGTDGRFVVRAGGSGTIRLAGFSLFGPTFKNRPNGNRPDLMALLAGMRPSFLRLPGGNYLEGDTVAERFDWKKTLGPIQGRPGHRAPWSYRSSDGMGLLEYLQWCEDLRMKPLLAVFAGYALRGEHVEPGPALAPYVQDALDEIEYVSGDAKTKWGAVRAKDGHPKPFPLEYVEIGNEDWFDRSGSYDGRFTQFYDAIRAKYPQLRLIATTGVKTRTPDVVDDHYYRTAAQMAGDSTHYDATDRKGPKIFVGEWASLQGEPTPDFQAALGDAAWLTGLERNSDIVVMEAYAPLLTNVNPGAAQWNTNLIGYDGLRAFGSPAYWVQAMFAQNQGETELPVEIDTTKAPEAFPYRGGVGVTSARGEAEFKAPSVEGESIPSPSSWTLPRGWTVADGSIRTDGSARGGRAVSGDPSWTDLTYRVQARRTSSGIVGVVFHALDDHNYWQWNLGDGTNEIRHTEIFSTRSVAKGGSVALPQGQWIDLRLEVRGGHVRGYVDGKLAIEADETAPMVPTIYACASRTGKETILKVVNLSATATDLKLDLSGAKANRFGLSGWSITGPLWGQNSVADPTRVAPRALPKRGISVGEPYRFPPYSVTILRLLAD